MHIKIWQIIGIMGLLLMSIMTGCSTSTDQGGTMDDKTSADSEVEKAVYQSVTPEDAVNMMDTDEEVILIDVREQNEYDDGHINNAVLLPLGDIQSKAVEVLPDYNQTIIVYCRSGNRSRQAANQLLEMGYTDVYDLGGIIDWPYEVVK